MTPDKILISQEEIASRIDAVAASIVSSRNPPTLMVPLLSGGFMFAADLSRALYKHGLNIPIEFAWLKRDLANDRIYWKIGPPKEKIFNQKVLFVDGVLDSGKTIAKAIINFRLLLPATTSICTLIDKGLPDAVLKADYSCFTGDEFRGFVTGYGMDRNGEGRSCPYVYESDPED